jgi:uncharacterized protein involved in exopolysaccharide biosynthesis
MSFSNNKWVGALALVVVIAVAVLIGNLATDKYMETKVPTVE